MVEMAGFFALEDALELSPSGLTEDQTMAWAEYYSAARLRGYADEEARESASRSIQEDLRFIQHEQQNTVGG